MKKALGYLLALVVGLVPGFFIVFNSVFADSSGAVAERLITFVLTVIAYGIIGLVFGYLKPEPSWRWGVWLSLPAVMILVLYSVKETSTVLLNLLYLLITLISACGASWIGAKLANRRR